MLEHAVSAISICPLNIKAFGLINSLTSNMEATLLYSKIKFHQKNSVIMFDEKNWIIRSRSQICEWFKQGDKKIDYLLKILESSGLLEKKVTLWCGKKTLMLRASDEHKDIPVNHKNFSSLIDITGSLKNAIVFSKIAFSFANTNIEYENKKWCSIKKEDLANWVGVSIRNLDGALKELIRKGLILKKNLLRHEKVQSHYHIPDYAIQVIHKNYLSMNSIEKQTTVPVATTSYENITANNKNKPLYSQNQTNTSLKISNNSEIEPKNATFAIKTSTQICRLSPAEIGKSIIIRSNTKETNNNTQGYLSIDHNASDITLIKSELSFRQEKYLEGALKNTIARSSIHISNPKELLDQLRFAITNPQQHKTITSFPHVVSRFMRIIAQRNWKTPVGFYQYSETGYYWKQQQIAREQIWVKQKSEEIADSEKLYMSIISNRKTEISTSTELTRQGKILAERIAELARPSYQESTEKTDLVRTMLRSLQGLLHQGADREVIQAILRRASDSA